MTTGTWALVAVAGAVGALARHEVTARAGHPLLALHVCNVLGSLVLGLVIGLGATGRVGFAFGAGGLGAFTSFSTWVVGARQQGGARHVVLPLLAAIGAAVLGTLVGAALGGGT